MSPFETYLWIKASLALDLAMQPPPRCSCQPNSEPLHREPLGSIADLSGPEDHERFTYEQGQFFKIRRVRVRNDQR